MNLDELQQYVGKYVETTRRWTPEERQKYPYLYADEFGGAGMVTEVFEEHGMLMIQMDWGMAWMVDDATEIRVREKRDGRSMV